jgi:hypothetical protein
VFISFPLVKPASHGTPMGSGKFCILNFELFSPSPTSSRQGRGFDFIRYPSFVIVFFHIFVALFDCIRYFDVDETKAILRTGDL